MPPNIFVPEYNDFVVGNLIIVGINHDKNEPISLTNEQIIVIQEYLEKHSFD